MQILVTNDNVIMFVGTIEKGIYDADPSRELYKITNEQGDFYAVTEGFTPITVDEVPADVEPIKWCYTNEKGFFENENYVEPVNPDQKVRELEAKLNYVSIMTGVEL